MGTGFQSKSGGEHVPGAYLDGFYTGSSDKRLVRFVTGWPSHDFHYGTDAFRAEVDWRVPHDLATGLVKTIDLCLARREWWQPLRAACYVGQWLEAAA
jgi:dTDP-D-glucose 4,6-dehydratase